MQKPPKLCQGFLRRGSLLGLTVNFIRNFSIHWSRGIMACKHRVYTTRLSLLLLSTDILMG